MGGWVIQKYADVIYGWSHRRESIASSTLHRNKNNYEVIFEETRFAKIFLNQSVLDSEGFRRYLYERKLKIEMRHHIYLGRVITGLFYIYIVYHVKRCEDLPYMNYVFFSKYK